MRRAFFGLLSFGLLATALGTTVVPAAAAPPTIVGIASTTPGFETLTAAVVCTGLVPALSGPTHLTVFAPNNAAFAKLGLNAGNVCAAFPNKADLTNILLYHVTPGTRLAGSLLPDEGETTKVNTLLSGQSFKITSTAGIRTSSGGRSQIVATDILASNGVIHVVDTVLIPGAGEQENEDQGGNNHDNNQSGNQDNNQSGNQDNSQSGD